MKANPECKGTASSPTASCARQSQVDGKNEITGRTDLEVEVSNQCPRSVCHAIAYYNSAILSRLPTKYEVSGNGKALEVVASTSSAAWEHIHQNGRYGASPRSLSDHLGYTPWSSEAFDGLGAVPLKPAGDDRLTVLGRLHH